MYRFGIILEQMDGSLYDISERWDFSYIFLLASTAKLLECNIYLRGKGIVHGDIKPENILCKWDNQSGTFKIKLSDFGLATVNGEPVVGLTPGFAAQELLWEQYSEGFLESMASRMTTRTSENLKRGVCSSPAQMVYSIGKTVEFLATSQKVRARCFTCCCSNSLH